MVTLSDGYNPFDGVSSFVFTEDIEYTALAGDPIYVDCDAVDVLFSGFSEESQDISKSDTAFVLVHELSHTFDCLPNGDFAQYCFDKEFFATLRAISVLKSNEYKIDESFLTNKPKLESGFYNYEVFMWRILSELNLWDTTDWSVINDTINDLRDDTSIVQGSEADVLKAFLNKLSQHSGIDMNAVFTDKEMEVIMNNYR